MVGLGTLTPVMLVRIQTPEPSMSDMREHLDLLNYMAHIGIIEEEDARIFSIIEEESISGSSNGRTAESESAYRGSNPCPEAK